MLSLKCIWVSISYFLLTACNSVDKTKSKGDLSVTDTLQKWKVLTSGTQCNIISPRQVLIKNQTDFDKLWRETFANSSSEIKKPFVDFTTQWVISAYLGIVKSGGHRMEIKEVDDNENTVSIIIKHLKPGKGCATTEAIEYPYIFVSIDHFLFDKIEFNTLDELYACD